MFLRILAALSLPSTSFVRLSTGATTLNASLIVSRVCAFMNYLNPKPSWNP